MSEPYLPPPEDQGAKEPETGDFFVRIGKLFVAGACRFRNVPHSARKHIQSAVSTILQAVKVCHRCQLATNSRGYVVA